ncbi:Imm8 family immunity protein [Kordiimonas sp. SCSIO 12610]|uniref:Imm8 family immunity protein n=1 Tax=Kordiimonas sp. SCSIO 12610 TaxID=2829597 RepID=UPI002109EC98|nr:Imm8 family immunity protein [Kordiimonas sp. SCSIO 12610]UTW56755.1 hypothetical protein KFF44_07665 [Kordiimonas sp. SCSIO 12610]
MKAHLDGIWSSVIPDGQSQPEDQEDFWADIVAEIGPEHGKGAEMFTFQVCSPKWLEHSLKSNDFIIDKNLIIIEKFDWQLIETAIKKLIARFECDTWEELAKEIDRYGEWEFHNYKEVSNYDNLTQH